VNGHNGSLGPKPGHGSPLETLDEAVIIETRRKTLSKSYDTAVDVFEDVRYYPRPGSGVGHPSTMGR